ncbi:MAG: carboxylating nicotinate-nucleotide diphosphorylase [Fusobacteria bacterium]|nr:carboxylating nicotinate-nucleotide diphosphorylase [Fusobacteriota bacterium]
MVKLQRAIKEAIIEDNGFMDAASYPLKGKICSAYILLKSENIVVSGIELIREVALEFGLKCDTFFNSGEKIEANMVEVMRLYGDASIILGCERVFLNVLSLMSGVATKTHLFSSQLKASGKKTKIAATRKTLPFLGEFQKLAVVHGGGDTHRMNLSDMAMIKDNHRALYADLETAIKEVKSILSFSKKLEVEVESKEEAYCAAKLGADIIMIDNMGPDSSKFLSKELKSHYPNLIIEVSGGIREQSFMNFSDDNIDIISTGILTSEVSYVDFSMEIFHD